MTTDTKDKTAIPTDHPHVVRVEGVGDGEPIVDGLLHAEWQDAGKAHAGILTSGHVNYDELLRRRCNFLPTRTAPERMNRLERFHDYR